MGFLYIDTSQLDLLRARLILTAERIPQAVQDSLASLSDEILAELADACPKGSGDGPNPPGDSDGPLAESFEASLSVQGMGAKLRVTTTQPTKLRYVREGRGPVYPVRAKALYWQGLDHPVKSAGPAAANDFVTPIVEEAGAMATEFISEGVREALTIL